MPRVTRPVSLAAAERRDDAARVDQVVGRRELLDAVEEERPLVGEEQRLARIELELPGVGLDLREVGVDRPVHRQGLGHAPAHVEAEVGPRAVVVPAIADGVPRAVDPRGRHRVEIEHQAAAQVVQPVERAGLRQKRRALPPGRRPAVLDALAGADPGDVQPPGLLGARLVAQALERDAELDLEAAVATSRPRDWKTKSGLRSTSSRPRARPPKPPPPVRTPSTSAPSICTPKGFTPKTKAWRPSAKVLRKNWT